MVKTVGLNDYSDVHFTNDVLAERIVRYFNPTLPCLEPCKGGGAFFRAMPNGSEWCEIAEGKDFFQYTSKVNWIITNPPFSNLTEWMEHSFDLAENVVFVLPISKIYSSAPRLEQIREYGGVRTMLHLGRGRSIGFHIGFPFAAMHFQRNYKGPIHEDWLD